MELFKTQFCDIIKHQICTSTAELNFDELTTEGTYEIYEDAGNGKTRVYLLTVDKSASGNCIAQTRVHCGKMEYRRYTSEGVWTNWETVSGGGGSEGGSCSPSDTPPLMDGNASAGSEESFARGDHIHPTDTTRASAEEVNELRESVANKIENNSLGFVLGNGSDKTEISYDGINPDVPFNINMRNGELRGCGEGEFEFLKYWDFEKGESVYVHETIGNIETALNNIIAIQNRLIGGDA